MSTGDWIALGSAVATFLGVLVAIGAIIYQGRKITHQLVLQNFSEYTKRYQEIILKFPEDIERTDFQAGRAKRLQHDDEGSTRLISISLTKSGISTREVS